MTSGDLRVPEVSELITELIAKEQHRRKSLGEAVRAAQRAVELTRSKYQVGLIDFSEVLDAERSQLL